MSYSDWPSATHRFFISDPSGDGNSFYETAEERDQAISGVIDAWNDDGWSEEVENVFAGIVTHTVEKTNVQKKPNPCAAHPDHDGENCDACEEWNEYPAHDYDECCDYEPVALDVAPTAPTADAQPIITFDDGARVILDSWTGGMHEAGSFGEITLRFVDEHGSATVREYRAKDAPTKATADAVTLTGAQLLEALDFIAPDRDTQYGADQLESEITIQHGEGHSGKGLYCWLTEYPEEGATLLDGSTATALAQPSEAAVGEPTKGMLDAARDWSLKKYGQGIGNDAAIGCWNAMRSAMPAQPDQPSEAQTPIPMLLFCPKCGEQHVDDIEATLVWTGGSVPEPSHEEITWDNPPHRSHLCHKCGTIWRPADVATVGVKAIETEGKADTWQPSEAQTAVRAMSDLQEYRSALCSIGVVGNIDGHEVIRRGSAIELLDRRLQSRAQVDVPAKTDELISIAAKYIQTSYLHDFTVEVLALLEQKP